MALKKIFGKTLLAIVAASCLAQLNFAQKKTLRVAAAADLQSAMPEIAQAFEQQAETSVEVLYRSSGNFYPAIQNAPPLDIFFFADSHFSQHLEQSQFSDPHHAAIH